MREVMRTMRMRQQAMLRADVWERTYEPRDRHTPDEALWDSETDFDDEGDDDQLPLDEVEAIELGLNLDDPEEVAREDADVD
jgi:hypothetical protein